MLTNLLKADILRNSFFLLAERGLSMVLSLCVGIYVIRYLGPERYGVLSYVLSFVGVLLPFSNLGYATITIREMVKNPDFPLRVLGSSLALNVLGSVVVFFVLNASAYVWLEAEARPLVLILSLQLVFRPLSTIDDYFQSIVRAKFPVLARSIGQVLHSLLRLLAVFLGAGLVWFVAINTFTAVVVAGLMLLFYYRHQGNRLRDWQFDAATARQTALASWPLILTNAFNVVILRIDHIIIKDLLDNTQVGLYGAAATLSESWYFLPGVLLASVFPLLVRSSTAAREQYHRELTALCSVFFYVSLIIAAGVALTADWLIPFLMGERFAPAAIVLQIHVWAGVFVFLGRPVTKALIIDDLTGLYLGVRLLAAAINIGLNYLLIPHHGIAGAAFATLVSYAFAHVFSLALFAKTRPYFLLQLRAIIHPLLWLYRRARQAPTRP